KVIVNSNGQDSANTQVATVAPTVKPSDSPQPANLKTLTIAGTGFDPNGNNLVFFNDDAVGIAGSSNAAGTLLTVSLQDLPTTAGPLLATVSVNGVSSGVKVQVAVITPVVTFSQKSLAANADKLTIDGF